MKSAIAIFLALLFTGCQGQEKEKEKQEENSKEKKELAEKPKGEWEVHREYDEQGNLIKYDSVYRYVYPDVKGDSVKVNLDSVMDSFRGYFEEHSPFKLNYGFSYFPEADSLFMKDFFKEDYFLGHWERQPMDIKEMMGNMDSTRNAFLRKYHPGLLESKEKDKSDKEKPKE